MDDPKNNGRTLWEMLTQRGKPTAAPVPFLNPLGHLINSPVAVSFVNGPEFDGYDFTVKKIREAVRRIGDAEFPFTDYVLQGINTKTFDHDDQVVVRLRVFPNDRGSQDAILLRLYDEMAFSEDFLAVVKDTTGIFEITDNDTGAKETYSRINDVEGSYDVAGLTITATTPDGKAPPGTMKNSKFEYWDYWRDADIGGGRKSRQYLFVEMDSDTGWFQIWRGREFYL